MAATLLVAASLTLPAQERVPTTAEPRPWVFWIAAAVVVAIVALVALRRRR